MNNYDVIIIGGGPIGLACGIAAKRKGLSYLILEKGCLVNSIYNYPKNMTFFSTSERLEIGNVPFISHGPKPTRSEALEYYRRVATTWELNIHTYEEVESVDGEKGNFTVNTKKDKYTCANVIISIGFFDYPNMMNVPGEDLQKVKHYYDEPHPYAGERVLVIGGGNSAVDVALETYRRGSEVTLVVKKNTLEKNVKYWVRPDIENRIKEGEIKAYFNSTVKEIREKEVVINTPDGEKTIANDFVLAMTGYHPDFNFLDRAGIEVYSTETIEPYYDDETFETNIHGMYLAGVVCGGMRTGRWFIENSRYHADNIFTKLAEEKSSS